MGYVYTSAVGGWTPIAHADGASALANSSYHALRTAAATDVLNLKEVFISGEGVASAVNRMAVRRNSTNVSSPTNVAPGPNSPSAPAASPQQYVLATTGPTIASTNHLFQTGLNVFGGLARWASIPGAEILAIGTAAPNGELTCDSVSGTGLVTTSLVFETL